MAETGMVEKVARALRRANVCDWSSAELGGHSVEQMVDTTWQAYKPDARAAIEAMPLAGLVALLERASAALRAVNHDSLADDIDAILKEGD